MAGYAAIPILRALPPKWRKPVAWFAAALLAYAILGFLVLPPIIRAVAASQLSRQLDREVSIRAVRLNPFVLSATVRGLLIKDEDGQPFVSWDEVYVNFQLSSFLGHPWVFKEVRAIRPYIRAQMNHDYTLNFSDIITKFSTNTPAQPGPSKPVALRVDRIEIVGGTASLADLTPREPFRSIFGPFDLKLTNFRTDPRNENPYSFSGTTDAGETFSWNGHFGLAPLRSAGEISVKGILLKKYAPLYQDLVRFQIKDGVVDLHSIYNFELSESNRIAIVTNASCKLRSLKVAEPGSETNFIELPEFSVTGASMDATARRGEIASVAASGARVVLRRDKNSAINVIELSKPAEGATNAPGGVLLVLSSITNAVAMLLNSTNLWTATVDSVDLRDGAARFEDFANARPVRLEVEDITFSATNISNLPGTEVRASTSLRWNTNGTIKTDVRSSFIPMSADIHLDLNQLELSPLDPYLDAWVNLFVVTSKLSIRGDVLLRAGSNALPQVTFNGDARLDDFSTVDGALGEDLLKWGSVRVSGIDARIEPPGVAIREVAIEGASARLVIETNHVINLLAALRPAGAMPAPPSTTERPKKAASAKAAARSKSAGAAPGEIAIEPALPNVSVAGVVISNGQISFTDRSVTPTVDLAIGRIGGTIGRLSSAELHHAEVKLGATVDNIGPVEITGTINPLRKDETNDLKITARNVDLTPTSPYVGKFAGYRLAQGKLDLELSYHLIGNKLTAENQIVLDRFTFGDKVSSPDATKLPVRLAVAILKDRDGKIVLDVPIEGSLDDPDFKVHKVVIRAISNLLTKIATSPFSVLGAAFGGRSQDISGVDFTPGSAGLQPAGKTKLDLLAKALYERPALQLAIDGSVDPVQDRDGLQRGALERRLRSQKWRSLRKSERATMSADQLTLTAEERPHRLKKAYAEALTKGEIRPATAEANRQAAPPASTNLATAAPPSWRDAEAEKGATMLMKHGENVAAVAARPASGVAAPRPASPAEAMEQALLDSITISDSDFRELASERAKAAREYLMQSGRVDGARVFLGESGSAAAKSDGSRAYFQLQ
jgi:hypothetical protein